MAEDPEMAMIRQRRMQELMGQGGAGVSEEQAQQQEEAQRAAEDQRRNMLHAVLAPEARERLARIALVKPEKARSVENMILTAAQRGALSEKVSEERLVSMLSQISEKESKPKVTIQRRRPMFDDDD